MMTEKKTYMENWLSGKIAEHEHQRQELLSDSREDEAAFEKITENVYDIFYTILDVADKTCKGDESAMQQFFLEKADQIPMNWQVSLEKAKMHDETDKMHIERIKLDAAQEIKEMFCHIWEVRL